MNHKILCLLDLSEDEQDAFREAAGEHEIRFLPPGAVDYAPVSPEFFRDADAIIGAFSEKQLPEAMQLRWLQARSSGVDRYTSSGLLKEGILLTSATGAYGFAVAEHMFAMLLSIMKQLPRYRDLQTACRWENLGSVRSPKGETVLVLGTGDLGSSFARLCRAFGAHTVGVRRDPSKGAEGFDEIRGMEELDRLSAEANVICCLLPHVEALTRYFDYPRLKSLKKDAIFLNGGRGSICDNRALAKVLSEGHLWGAGIETAEEEPLPADHPLWREERALITPHVAGGLNLEETKRRVAAISLENLKRYLAGDPLMNLRV